MIPAIPSYRDKAFIINDNLALIRNPRNLMQFSRYKTGDTMPLNAHVGQRKRIPLNTRIRIEDIRIDADRNVYVYAIPSSTSAFIPSGWTRSSNLAGNFLNEVIGYVPKEWDLEPMGNNFTVVDKKAFIRTGPSNFESLNAVIPYGSYVMVTARSRQTAPEAQYVRVRYLRIENGVPIIEGHIGWTHSSNLVEGNSKVFKSNQWRNTRGNNAAWKKGEFIGAKVLVALVGTGGQLQHVALETYEPYMKLLAAARKDNITISISSGFRTFAKQEFLYRKWKDGVAGYNLAAKPGRSNHQNGIAFDLNTTGFDNTMVYDWLKKNAPRFGFIRTVNKEHWHWEYLPAKASELRALGRFKLSRVVT